MRAFFEAGRCLELRRIRLLWKKHLQAYRPWVCGNDPCCFDQDVFTVRAVGSGFCALRYTSYMLLRQLRWTHAPSCAVTSTTLIFHALEAHLRFAIYLK